MGDMSLKCPLCCNQTFDSKLSLVEHLANILSNLTCPICENRWSSLAHLIEHLNLDDCQSQAIHIKTIDESEEDSVINPAPPSNPSENDSEIRIENVTTVETVNESVENENFVSSIPTENSHIEIKLTTDGLNDGKMYVEYVNHDKLNSCLQTQELKLLTEDGEMEQFVVMSPNSGELSLGGAIVTKQNEDGTISLTTVKDTKESETVITPAEVELEDTPELYSCNTCGVSFSSVAEHIQNYHNDQEVVVEEPMEDDSSAVVETLQYDTLTSEVVTPPKPKTRQIITENGDIVDAPFIIDNPPETEEFIVPNVVEKPKAKGKKFVQIDKFCDSLVKNIYQINEKDGTYHKVIMNESKAPDGTKLKTYWCLSCEISVSNLDDFKLHPCKVLKYQCVYCSVAYSNSKSLCAHMKVHKVRPDGMSIDLPRQDIPTRYECEICNTAFQSNKSLKLHKRMHDPVKARQIEPPVENADGTETSNCSYKCPICEKMIPMDYLAIHQESHKSNELNCHICNKKFYSTEYLQMHMTVHNMDKITVNKSDKLLPYSCSYCNRRFVRPHEKVKHERIHTGEKPHSCEICGKSFRVSYCLTLHMRTHTGARPYTCPHCGKRFKAHSVYNHHLLTHSEVRAYKCPYCPKAFKTSVQLAGHKNSHTKPFSCPHCNRPFASLYAVRVHSETHARQNNLKFSCSLCGASYARAFALKDHVKQVHQQDVDAMDLPVVNIAKINKDDWPLKESDGDVETITLTHKDLSQEICELEMSSSELIDPIKVTN
ncbi:zinc finger protein 595-like [Ostrinia nubilalis]|uniref:zinc finger protein 595-like n=1 Tax=Ostrinia furnacalis TaxID=93504 RepID=UPI00103D8708|nr:zinc finger protein 595-like [Ostrinia furnacalis]